MLTPTQQAVIRGWPRIVREEWDERAAILQFDAGFDLHEAEERAYQWLIQRQEKKRRSSQKQRGS